MSGSVTIKDDKFLMPDGDVEVKAIFEEDTPPAPTEYTITVTSGGNGTASASHAKAAAGTEITLTATPNKGFRFKEWQVISGKVTIKDDKFLMPDSNVEVKAIFEKDAPPAPTEFTITFDGNDGTPSVGSMTTTNQKLTSLPSASRSGSYSFDGWYTEKSGGTKITTDNLRGFVLDNTSGFEVRIREVLNICWQKFNTEQRKCLSDALVALLDGKKSHVKKQVEQAKDQECPFAYANNDEYALGIADRLDILQIVLPILTTAYHMPAATKPRSRCSSSDGRGPAWPPARRCSNAPNRHGPQYRGKYRSSPDSPSG